MGKTKTTQRERQEARRRAKLDHLEGQIVKGTLTIRTMTPAERKKYGPPKDLDGGVARRRRAARREANAS